jgi:hypothetical protein
MASSFTAAVHKKKVAPSAGKYNDCFLEHECHKSDRLPAKGIHNKQKYHKLLKENLKSAISEGKSKASKNGLLSKGVC